MRVYKKMTIISALIAIVAFFGAVFMHYCFPCDETEFWINVCLGIFGSAVLTGLTSVVSYNHEKIKTLENFLYHTRQLLSVANKYQEHMTLEEKIRFFLEYSEFDKIAWDADFGNIDFFFERITKSREYIYCSIYKPILDFNHAVANHVWHFRWHLDGSGKNDAVMQTFVSELQDYLLKIDEQSLPTEHDENGTATSFCRYISTCPKLVLDVRKELAGRYYEVLYGRKTARKAREEITERGDNKNG